MKATEKKVLENLYQKIEQEVQEANNETDKAYEQVMKNNYDDETYKKYTRKYSYMNGLQMGKTIVIGELRKLGIEVK